MTDNYDLIETPEIAKNAMGGTELLMRRLYDGKVPRDILEQFQIIPTRVGELKPDKYRILYCHDLPEDPAVQHLAHRGWRNFHRIVFVSNWQAQRFIEKYDIPWSRVVVILNSIEPLTSDINRFDSGPIRIIYHTTPHRGLNLLVPVFDRLSQEFDNITLDIFSSFRLYGWEERDAHFKELFDQAAKNPKITNHGSVDQALVRNALSQSHIFAYPSIWPETSCLCLMEAMSAGLVCIHPNYGALFETASNWTHMYHFHEDLNEHAKMLYIILKDIITNLSTNDALKAKIQVQKNYADSMYNWNSRAMQWEAFLRSVLSSNESKGIPNSEFVYNY